MEATLEAVQRSTRGKNDARRLRASGRIPAVVYGAQKAGDAVAPLAIAVDPKPLTRILHDSGANTLITLKVDGAGEARVLVKDLLVDPTTSQLMHADFYRVNMDRKVTVEVPIVLRGEPKGVKLQGGVLDFLQREVELECLPGNIPEHIEIDVSEMNLGDAVYVRDIAPNASWNMVTPGETMLVHVVALKVAAEPEAAEGAAAATAAPAAAAEPEVIKKGKVEKEGEEKKGK
ncbi:MAG: 50S ribosomal protein L25 [Acidobacteriota bacterium]